MEPAEAAPAPRSWLWLWFVAAFAVQLAACKRSRSSASAERMELAAVHSPAAAFAAGLVTSLHCAGMCGPLACALLPARAGAGSAQAVATAYHGARLAAYGLLGAVAGGLGAAPLGWVGGAAARWLPWLTVL
ncbi:MAG: hypothetical protein RL479_642, partial [Verrucomicrobiota bacterium]